MITVLKKSGSAFPRLVLVEMDRMVLLADPEQKQFQIWLLQEPGARAEVVFQADKYEEADKTFIAMTAKSSGKSAVQSLMRQYIQAKPRATVRDFARFLRLAKQKGLLR